MSHSKYSEEDDYYTQNFEQAGVVSIWLARIEMVEDKNIDALQDLCGVGYYRLDNQEAINLGRLASVDDLLRPISYSESFAVGAKLATQSRGIASAWWILVQFDFKYDPSRVRRPLSDDLLFVGAFPYIRVRSVRNGL